jgi:hypothetical protein
MWIVEKYRKRLRERRLRIHRRRVEKLWFYTMVLLSRALSS